MEQFSFRKPGKRFSFRNSGERFSLGIQGSNPFLECGVKISFGNPGEIQCKASREEIQQRDQTVKFSLMALTSGIQHRGSVKKIKL